MNRTRAAVIIAAVLLVAGSSFYAVDETEQVLLTFLTTDGAIVGGPITTAGLKLKAPFPFHRVKRMPKMLMDWDGDPGQVPTKDKTFIGVDTFGRWRIADALKYFEQVGSETRAQRILDGIIDAAVRNSITSSNLIEAVRNTNRAFAPPDFQDSATADTTARTIELGRSAMCGQILKEAQPKLREFGIELVDIRIKRINYVNEVLQNVYGRMIAERQRIAEKYRSEGKGDSLRIVGKKERELKRIYAEAYREAETIKGKADSTAAEIYAKAYSRDPEFYSFIRTLEMYKTSLDSTTWAVLSTKSDFLKYLKDYSPQR